jgi:hypothetical protein
MLHVINVYIYSRDSSVGIATGYGLDDRGWGVRFPARDGNFYLLHRVQNGSGPTQPPVQWVQGALSSGVKRPGREADHSSPSAKVKNAWRYTSTPIRLITLCVTCHYCIFKCASLTPHGTYDRNS